MESKSLENENYEQFETMEIEEQNDKKHVKKHFFYYKRIIKYGLLIISVLFLLVLLSLFLDFKNNKKHEVLEINESKKEDKSLSSLDSSKCEPGYKLVDNKCQINHSIRAEYHTEKKTKK